MKGEINAPNKAKSKEDWRYFDTITIHWKLIIIKEGVCLLFPPNFCRYIRIFNSIDVISISYAYFARWGGLTGAKKNIENNDENLTNNNLNILHAEVNFC
jgi:hypothetical protein